MNKDIEENGYTVKIPRTNDCGVIAGVLVPRKDGGSEFVEVDPAPVIKRVQFIAYDRHVHPEIYNDEYLEHEIVETGLSSGVCSFGWIEIDTVNDGYRWVKKADVPK